MLKEEEESCRFDPDDDGEAAPRQSIVNSAMSML